MVWKKAVFVNTFQWSLNIVEVLVMVAAMARLVFSPLLQYNIYVWENGIQLCLLNQVARLLLLQSTKSSFTTKNRGLSFSDSRTERKIVFCWYIRDTNVKLCVNCSIGKSCMAKCDVILEISNVSTNQNPTKESKNSEGRSVGTQSPRDFWEASSYCCQQQTTK